MTYDEALAGRIREIVCARPGVTERRMFGGIGWMVGGNMAVGAMSTGGLLVRLSPEDAEAALREPGTSTFGREGAKPMKGFVVVDVDPDDDARLAEWIEAGANFAASLPPK